MLAGPSGEPAPGVDVAANLKRMREMLAGMGTTRERSQAERQRRARETADQLAAAKRETAQRVAAYEGARP